MVGDTPSPLCVTRCQDPEPAPLNLEQQVRENLLVLVPLWTPGRFDWPLFDSMVPMAARIVQGSPGQEAAACW